MTTDIQLPPFSLTPADDYTESLGAEEVLDRLVNVMYMSVDLTTTIGLAAQNKRPIVVRCDPDGKVDVMVVFNVSAEDQDKGRVIREAAETGRLMEGDDKILT